MTLDIADFNMSLTIKNILSMYSSQVEQKGLYLRSHIEEGIPEIITGDERRLRQILVNLIGNAIKFTHSGVSM